MTHMAGSRPMPNYQCYPCAHNAHLGCADRHALGSSWSFCTCKADGHQYKYPQPIGLVLTD